MNKFFFLILILLPVFGISQSVDNESSLIDFYKIKYLSVENTLSINQVYFSPAYILSIEHNSPEILLPDYTKNFVPEELSNPFCKVYYEFKDGSFIPTYLHYKPSYYPDFHNPGPGIFIE
ncbi:MAG: hypothetical protein A2W91_10805 [Bacteroidetes bacterium GWF2_38_335]|nr:MAG: hypothetical protein A2W91_10805 [Bacteroidetes bacterium GWF2_38_335]OFY81808.1 MAG: hypothetical protein A2281_06235 [Bacteroidetes bacterium RIFOXYA12_FULL_38_20]HBS87880.1 hypothetical protein [Bacteroidales bacterium]